MSDDQNKPITITPPVFQTEDVLPPLPENKMPEEVGSAAPAEDIIMPAVVTNSSNTKKKYAGGKVIATILGLFLLVGGVGAGVFLTGQNQNINEKAGGPVACHISGWESDCKSVSEPGACGNDATTKCEGSEWCEAYREEEKCVSAIGGSNWKWCCNGTGYVCKEVPGKCGVPEPTPTVTAQCSSTKAYTPAWVLLTSTQLSALHAGDVVNFCATGTTTSGSFDKARFTINGTLQAETTTKRPTSEDYCQSYTIPAGVTVFNVTAEIHHTTLGWK